MKKLLIYALLLLVGASLVGCHEEPVVEPVTPIIKGQSLLSGAMDVTAEPQTILILFDREVEVYDASLVTLTPASPLEVRADGVKVAIEVLEKLQYNTEYTLTIGAGAIADKKTGGGNLSRTIIFHTEEGPYTPPEELTMQLVSHNALPVAQELYSFMWSINDKATLSGAMASVAWDLNECDWVKRYAGHYPVVATFDYQYIHLSPSSSISYADIAPVEKWWSEGGIVAIDWHWMVPQSEGSRSFTNLREGTTVTVKNMLTEGTWENEQMMRDFKEVADMLLLLQEKNIPVLWRPLPQTQNPRYATIGNGEYYWWCGASKREYKELWHRMFDYFEQRGVRNLIWVWTSQIQDIEFYPGEEWVDMVAVGLYNCVTSKEVSMVRTQLNNYFPHKMISLGEMGNLPTMSKQLEANLFWSYIVPRSDRLNNFTEGFQHSAATIEWWRESFADQRFLSRTTLSALKAYQPLRAYQQVK